MITNIFEFGDKDVTDVMTSRKKIDAIDVNMSVEKALNYMLDEPYSRYPLYEDDIDNIVGVLYLKDVIDAYLNQKEATLSDIAREPFFGSSDDEFIGAFSGDADQEDSYGDRY